MTRRPAETKMPRPTPRGWARPFGGFSLYLSSPDRWRSTSNQVCGMWPFAVGAGVPQSGAPLGDHLGGGGTGRGDPYSWFQDGYISSPSEVVIGLNGQGKALDVDTVIPTPDGYARMGDLQPGDYVIGGDGAPVPIVAVSEVMVDRECFELTFSTGERIVADAEHLWQTETLHDRWHASAQRQRARAGQAASVAVLSRPSAGVKGAVTSRQIAATLYAGGKANHAVAVMPGLDLPAEELPVHPYVLGAWLGDGTSAGAELTCNDPELLDTIRAAGVEVAPTASRMRYRLTLPGTRRSKLNGLQPRLRALGVLGNKHIPVSYLRGSAGQRRTLLAGLLDTDGTISPSGSVQYVSTNRRLAEDVTELVASLGYRPVIRESRARIRGVDCGPMFIVTFTTSETVFELPRKIAAQTERVRGRGARTRARYITDASPVASRPVRCIQVGADDGLFQVGRTFITTHNSTLIAKQILCLEAMGVLPLVLGDLKGEYADLITTIGGQVIDVGSGRGTINPLDPGETAAVSGLLTAEADRAVLAGNHGRAERMRTLRRQVLAEAHTRAVSATSGLITILRGGTAPEDHEESVLNRGIRLLEAIHEAGLSACPCPDKKWHRVGCPDRPPSLAPELRDLLDVITAGHPDLHAVAVAADRADYQHLTVRLRRSLTALVEGSSRLGDTFAGQTTTPMRRDRPVCVNIAAIDDSQSDLQAAVLLASWAAGFAMVHVAHVLADAGLEPRRHRFVVMDEFWRVLRSGAGMVDRADALTRLDRQKGVARAFIFHTMEDLEALPEIERIKARGFVARSGMLVCFGLPPSEMRLLRGVTYFSRKEEQQITSWTTPPSWAPSATPPGLGKCLIKVGRKPGLPVRVRKTSVEADLHNTNRLWKRVGQVGSATDLAPVLPEVRR